MAREMMDRGAVLTAVVAVEQQQHHLLNNSSNSSLQELQLQEHLPPNPRPCITPPLHKTLRPLKTILPTTESSSAHEDSPQSPSYARQHPNHAPPTSPDSKSRTPPTDGGPSKNHSVSRYKTLFRFLKS